MNFDDVKRATRLIGRREDLQKQLERLGQAGGFPHASVEYITNAGVGVIVEISKEMQPSIETLLHTILSSQISQIENDLAALGVKLDV